MKILVCGDRNWTNVYTIYYTLLNVMAQEPGDYVLIHGDCRGADRLSEKAFNDVCKVLSLTATGSVARFPALWDQFGERAGPLRNRQMLDKKPDIVIAFHSNLSESEGTLDCVMEANRRGIKVMVIP